MITIEMVRETSAVLSMAAETWPVLGRRARALLHMIDTHENLLIAANHLGACCLERDGYHCYDCKQSRLAIRAARGNR